MSANIDNSGFLDGDVDFDEKFIEIEDAPPFDYPDSLDNFYSDLDYGNELVDYQQQRDIQRLKEKTELHDIRKDHAKKLFNLILGWLSFVGLLIFIQGIREITGFGELLSVITSFHLSDAVMIAVITSTTASVLGLYAIAAYWLFGRKNKKLNGNDNVR